MAGPQLPFTEILQNPLSFLGVDTKPAQPTNRLEKEAADFGAREEQFLKSNIDLTRDLGKMMLKDAEGKNLLAIKEKELQAVHDRQRKRIRDELGDKFYNSPDMQEFKKFADESADKMMFVPSQTTAPLLGVVFATIGATGLLLGGLSKGNAKAALSAMNGMAEGFAKGKEDLYKQERQTFDTNVKAMTQRMGILKSKLDVAREKMKYDAEAADLEANAAFAEAGADFLKANKDKFGLQDSIIKLETQIKQNDTWARLMETKKSAAIKELEAQRFKAHESELNRNQQTSIQKMLESGREQRAAELIESRERTDSLNRQTRALIAQLGQQGVQPIGMANGQLIVIDKSGNISARTLPEGFQGIGKLADKTPKTPGARDAYGFGEIVAGASNEAAKTLTNIMGLPAESTSGLFGGRQTTSLFTAPIDAFANQLTPESAQRYQAEMNKLAYYIAQMQKGGRVVGATEVGVINKSLEIRKNDTIETVATRLAQARQMAEKIIEIKVASLNTPEPLKEIYKENLKDIQQSVPFTVEDINKFVQRKTGAPTFGQSFKERYKTPEPTADDRALGKSSPEMKKKFVAKFGVEP
jgi:hypothetical protein